MTPTRTNALRRDLAQCLSPLEVERSHETTRFRGSVRASETLVGPPGRLHGGLHPSVRLLLPLARLTSDAVVRERTLSMELRMRRAIAIGEEVPIEGELTQMNEHLRLSTRTAGTERLDAELRTGAPDTSSEVLNRFRALLEVDAGACDRESVTGHGNLEVGVGGGLVRVAIDTAWAARTDVRMTQFLAPGPAVDPTFTCGMLDVIGAYALGMNLDCLLFTTQLSLVVHGGAPVTGDGMLVLGSRHAEDVPNSELPKVPVRDREVGEQRVEVLLADRGLTRAYGYGHVALVPVRARA